MQFEEYAKKVTTNVENIKESWGVFLHDISSSEFESLGDVVLLGLAVCKFESCIDELAELTPDAEFAPLDSEEVGEMVLDVTVSAVSLLRYMKDILEKGRSSCKDTERALRAGEIRSTLFSIMRDSQEFIMGE